MLLLICNHTTIAHTFGSLATKDKLQLIARNAIVQHQHVVIESTIGLLLHINVAYPGVSFVRLFHTVQVEGSIFTHIGLNDLCRQEAMVVNRMITEKEFGLCSFFHDNQHPSIHHQVDIRSEEVNHLNRLVHLDTFGDINKQSILSQHGI